MRIRVSLALVAAVGAAVALHVQAGAQKGRGRGVAAGGTTAGAGQGYPTPDAYAGSKEALAHVAKAKAIAGGDARLPARFEHPRTARPAAARARGAERRAEAGAAVGLDGRAAEDPGRAERVRL